MDVTFLFLDESVDLDTAWLTGVFVPAEQYADVRDAVLRIAQEALIEAGHEHPAAVELHAVDLLRDVGGVTDDHRFKVFEKIVALVNAERLEIVRVGHSGAKKIREHFTKANMDPGDKLYSHNFREVVEALRLPEEGLVFPVFDGVPPQQQALRRNLQPVDRHAYDAFMFGGHITQWGRVASEAKPVPWVEYKTNLRNLGEPAFSDSARSPLLQLADMVGYLLCVADRVARAEHSEWKARIARIARKIDPGLVYRRSIMMHINGPK